MTYSGVALDEGPAGASLTHGKAGNETTSEMADFPVTPEPPHIPDQDLPERGSLMPCRPRAGSGSAPYDVIRRKP